MSPERSKVIIELYGLPGSGKSTFARQLAREHGFTHITATSVTRGEYFKLFLSYPRTVCLWLQLILKNFWQIKRIKQLRYNIALLFVSLKKIHLAKQSKDRFVIIDEGLVQRFLSYSEIILSEKEVSNRLSKSPIGTVLVCINDREVTTDRFDEAHDRGSLGPEYLNQWRQNMAQNIEIVRSVLKKQLAASSYETKTDPLSVILENTKK